MLSKPLLSIEKPSHTISLNDPIAQHVAWVFENIYKHPYVDQSSGEIPRSTHGIQHVARAALYVPVFVNLYRRYGDLEALKLTDEDIKLLQIALLFHDAGRQGDGEDTQEWEQKSGELLFNYLTNTLKVNAGKAKLLAEAVVNKDAGESYYEYDQSKWKQVKKQFKNIYQRIVQNADCLDIKRTGRPFEATYLDFYKDIAKKHFLAFEEMAHLMLEVTLLLKSQGDFRYKSDVSLRSSFIKADSYTQIVKSLFDNAKAPRYKVLGFFYNEAKVLSAGKIKQPILGHLLDVKYNNEKLLTPEKLEYLFWNGKILARGLADPVRIHKKPQREDESLAAFEIRKILRREGFKTRTNKPDNINKNGFLFRSTGLMVPNRKLYEETRVGYLIFNPDDNKIAAVVDGNAGTGRGKKKVLEILEGTVYLSVDDLLKVTKMHDSKRQGRDSGRGHTEVIYNIMHANAVFYVCPSKKDEIPFIPLLEAIYIQKEYAKQCDKLPPEIRKQLPVIDLPIIEYNESLHTVRQIRPLTHVEICNLWQEIAKYYWNHLDDEGKRYFYKKGRMLFLKNNIPSLKASLTYFKPADHGSLDATYDAQLQSDIDKKVFLTIAQEKTFSQFIKDEFDLTDDIKDELYGSLEILCRELNKLIDNFQASLATLTMYTRMYKYAVHFDYTPAINHMRMFAINKYMEMSVANKFYDSEFSLWKNFIRENSICKFDTNQHIYKSILFKLQQCNKNKGDEDRKLFALLLEIADDLNLSSLCKDKAVQNVFNAMFSVDVVEKLSKEEVEEYNIIKNRMNGLSSILDLLLHTSSLKLLPPDLHTEVASKKVELAKHFVREKMRTKDDANKNYRYFIASRNSLFHLLCDDIHAISILNNTWNKRCSVLFNSEEYNQKKLSI